MRGGPKILKCDTKDKNENWYDSGAGRSQLREKKHDESNES